MKFLTAIPATLGLTLVFGSCLAADGLTPIGAKQAGNATNTIPAWSPGKHSEAELLADTPLFTITQSNYQQYASNLTAGQIALFETYPNYRMRIFKTKRTAEYSDRIYAATAKNKTQTTLTPDGNGVLNFELGVPFSEPESGIETIWNHLLRYRGDVVERTAVQIPVQANGSYTASKFVDTFAFPQAIPGFYDPVQDDNVLFYFLQEFKSPARLTGNILLVHETVNQVKEPRRAWRYTAGQRRVRRAPEVAYDAPGTGADGQRTTDNFDLYNGAPDRYHWKLVGKREVYIPYNNHALNSKQLTYKELHQPGFVNPDHVRYELHRVWKVEATLKANTRHQYAKRVFHLDEDSWQIATADHYDSRDVLWRTSEAFKSQYFEKKIPWYVAEALYDVQSKRYITIGFSNQELGTGYKFDIPVTRADFSPQALRRKGNR